MFSVDVNNIDVTTFREGMGIMSGSKIHPIIIRQKKMHHYVLDLLLKSITQR